MYTRNPRNPLGFFVKRSESFNFQYIIGDLRGAGWSVRTVRENDSISDSDLYHVFKKVDIDNNQEITTTVGEERGCA